MVLKVIRVTRETKVIKVLLDLQDLRVIKVLKDLKVLLDPLELMDLDLYFKVNGLREQHIRQQVLLFIKMSFMLWQT